jgi:Family of unknown function (DUF5906)
MSDNDDEDRPHTPLLFPERIRNSTALPVVLKTKQEALEWLNKSYACITINGKYKVLHEKSDGEIEIMDTVDFTKSLADMLIDISSPDENKSKIVPITELWLKWAERRRYDNGFTFDPSRVGHHDGKYNLFKGYQIVPREGDCSIFLDYVKLVICSGNERDYTYLISLVAQMFQFPHLKPGIAVVLRGDEGVGKSFFIEKLGALMPDYYFKTSNPEYIFGDHNGQLKNKLMVHLEEAFSARSKKDESLLKDMITGSTIEINDKYIPVYAVPNHLHVFISGNPDWLVSAGFRARRLFALHVSDVHRLDTNYFSGIDKWFNSGGNAALMHYFLNYKSDVNLRIAPITEELIYQKKQGLSGVAEWAMSIGETGQMPYGELKEREEVIVGVVVIKRLLYHDFLQSPMGNNSKLSEVKFGMEFTRLFPKLVDGDEGDSVIKNDLKCKGARGVRFNAYYIPNIDVYRQSFDLYISGKTQWAEVKEWTVLRPNTTETDDIHGKKPF